MDIIYPTVYRLPNIGKRKHVTGRRRFTWVRKAEIHVLKTETARNQVRFDLRTNIETEIPTLTVIPTQVLRWPIAVLDSTARLVFPQHSRAETSPPPVSRQAGHALCRAGPLLNAFEKLRVSPA